MKIKKPVLRWVILPACILLAFLIGVMDWLTGEEYDFFVFYFVPIALSAWYLGKQSGWAMALLSAVIWPISDILSHRLFSPTVEMWDEFMRLVSFFIVAVALSKIKKVLAAERALTNRLSGAMAEIKQLQGILPMCSFCRKIRDNQDRWVPLEKYLLDYTDAKVSHGLCPACYKKHYGEADGT